MIHTLPSEIVYSIIDYCTYMSCLMLSQTNKKLRCLTHEYKYTTANLSIESSRLRRSIKSFPVSKINQNLCTVNISSTILKPKDLQYILRLPNVNIVEFKHCPFLLITDVINILPPIDHTIKLVVSDHIDWLRYYHDLCEISPLYDIDAFMCPCECHGISKPKNQCEDCERIANDGCKGFLYHADAVKCICHRVLCKNHIRLTDDGYDCCDWCKSDILCTLCNKYIIGTEYCSGCLSNICRDCNENQFLSECDICKMKFCVKCVGCTTECSRIKS